MKYIYSFFIGAFIFLMYLVSPFNKKAKLIIKGRKESFSKIKQRISKEDKVAWFHVASLGEFEQARPLIEKFKDLYPQYKILLTFFSPSGYEIRKDYDKADIVIYLPSDTIRNAKRFVELAHPDFVFFVKYEFWYNLIREAKQKGAKVYQVSLILRPSQYFFAFYGKWFRKELKNFDFFFVQNKETKELLKSIGFNNCIISGDTRFDRVREIANKAKAFPKIEEFCQNDKVILMGSSWEKDEELMKEAMKKTNSSFKLIIAPHQIHNSHIEQIISLFPHSIKYSEIEKIDYKNTNNKDKILIIDCIGILSSLYKYSTIACIGGGFGAGIHNILEAATFGKPILFGTNYGKFQEAKDLIEREGAFSFSNSDKLADLIDLLLTKEDYYRKCSDICISYVSENIGACEKILSKIDELQNKDEI